MSTLALKDPHTFAPLPFLGCRDITNSVPLGLGTAFNEMLQNSIDTDGDLDGSLDLNGLIYFVPQDIVVGTAGHVDGTQWDPEAADGELIFHFGACSPPAASTMCAPDIAQTIHRLAYANESATACLGPVAGTLNASYGAPLTPAAPCFFTEPFEMLLSVGGIPVPLLDVQLGATYVQSLPPRLVDGMIRGFLRETAADSVFLPAGIAIVGGQPLSSILPGGTGGCASHDDRDSHLGQTGWWVYLNFEADEVPFTAATGAPEEGAPRLAGTGPELRVSPNPFSGSVVLSARAATVGRMHLDVLDVRGRIVRSLGTAHPSRDWQEVVWDGTDRRGNPLPVGVYFVRLQSDDGIVTRKLVRAR